MKYPYCQTSIILQTSISSNILLKGCDLVKGDPIIVIKKVKGDPIIVRDKKSTILQSYLVLT